MKLFVKVILGFIALILIAIIAVAALTPWMDSWGATKAELTKVLPGDDLVDQPVQFSVRAVSVNASPDQVYPWIAQIGADRGGYYSYTGIDQMINCKLVDINEIVPEFQDPKIGDIIKMCPNEPAPPPFTIALVEKGKAIVLGHQEGEEWVESWQIVVLPDGDGKSRLIFRNRSEMEGMIWKVIHPGEFLMQTGMLKGIKARAEGKFN